MNKSVHNLTVSCLISILISSSNSLTGVEGGVGCLGGDSFRPKASSMESFAWDVCSGTNSFTLSWNNWIWHFLWPYNLHHRNLELYTKIWHKKVVQKHHQLDEAYFFQQIVFIQHFLTKIHKIILTIVSWAAGKTSSTRFEDSWFSSFSASMSSEESNWNF